MVTGLIIAVLGLGYFWMQLGGQDVLQRLDIRPQLADISADPEADPSQPGFAGIDAEAEAQPVQPVFNENDLSPTNQRLTISTAERSDADLSARQTITPTTSQAVSPRIARSATSSIVGPADSLAPADAPGSAGSVQVPAAVVVNGVIDNEELANDVVEIRAASSAPVGVINQPPPESIKDRTELSLNQQDTTAVQAALRLLAIDQGDAAYRHLERHIADNRYAHQSRETLAKLLMSQGQALEAANLIERGLLLAPNHTGFKKVKARLLLINEEIDEAVMLLMARAPEIAADVEYHDILATAQLASSDYSGAAMSYRGLVQQDQTQGKWWYGFARAQDALGNRQAARQAYAQAMQLSNLSASLRRRSQDRLVVLGQ
jgi:MSHA biogenesis protein MshN